MSAPLTVAEIHGLPAVVNVPTVAAALGVSVSHVYRTVAAGEFPLETLRLGRVIRFRRIDLLNILGIAQTTGVTS